MKLNRNLKYRCYPTEEQKVLIGQWMGTLRWLWNRFLEQWNMQLGRPKADKIKPSFHYPNSFDQAKEMTELQNLPEFEWIQETARHARTQVIIDLEMAWKRCFKGLARAPNNKPYPNSSMRVYHPICSSFRFELGGIGKTRQLKLIGAAPYRKLGSLKVIIDRPLQGKVKSWSIIREGAEYYVVACCEIEKEDPKPVNDLVVGIDRGVVNLIADSEGSILANPKSQDKLKQRILRLERKAAKQVKGSRNQRKTYDKINKLKRKAIRTQENLIDTATLHYAKSYWTVVIEKLQLTNMTASAKGTKDKPGKSVKAKSGLNRAILNASPGKTATRLRYKVEERGGQVIEVPPAYTSQECPNCGHIHADNRQTQSQFDCVACGWKKNADVNAAINIKAKGEYMIATGTVPVKKTPKKISRPRRKAKVKNAEVKPTLKQPVPRKRSNAKALTENSRSKGVDEAGTNDCEIIYRGMLDIPMQHQTINSEDTS